VKPAFRLSQAIASLVAWVLLTTGPTGTAAAASPGHHDACHPAVLSIDGNRVWARASGAGEPTVVFEAGFGNDSSVWSAITPRIQSAGVQVFIYDRAGMGKSAIDIAATYSVQNDVRIVRTALDQCGVKGPVVFVGHSYGGAIALLASTEDARIKGLVLIEAVVPGVWSPEEVDRNLKSMRPQYDEIRTQAPALAKVAIPWAEAMPQTAQVINTLNVSETLPIIDIEADHGQTEPDSAQTWKQAHEMFVAGHLNRERLVAQNSSHKVMADQPDLVVNAILKMIARVRSSQ
jgi:pimeloyl-ACP methyl ester carboxylesterase